MPLKCRIRQFEFSMSDIWTNEDEFNELGPDAIRECIKEDILSWIDDMGGIEELLNKTELFWSSK